MSEVRILIAWVVTGIVSKARSHTSSREQREHDTAPRPFMSSFFTQKTTIFLLSTVFILIVLIIHHHPCQIISSIVIVMYTQQPYKATNNLNLHF